MSQRNGDKARFQKNRMRKLQQRVRSRALVAGLATKRAGDASGAVTQPTAVAKKEKRGPVRAGARASGQ